jgi:hypothetical protein
MLNETKLTLLNTSILTSFGSYTFKPLTLEEAQALVNDFQQEGRSIQSAIGHQSTADLLTMLLGFPVAVNRLEFKQSVDDVALIFKLKGRPPEGKVLSREELEEMGYEFGLLKRSA